MNKKNDGRGCIMIQVLITCIDAVFLTRPMILISVWGFSVFGLFSAVSQNNAFDVLVLWQKQWLGACIPLLLFSLAVGWVNIINQVVDYETDCSNGGFALLASGSLSKRFAIIVSFCVLCITIFLLLIMGKDVLLLFTVAAMVLGILYCFKPFYFTGRPVGDFVTNALGYGFVAFGVGWYEGSSMKGSFDLEQMVLQCIPYVLLMAAGSMSSTIPDIEGDRQTGKITTAVFFGITKTHTLACVSLVGALICALLNHDFVAGICSVCALPAYGIYYFNKSPTCMEATYKIGGGLCMVIASILFWPLFIGSIVVFLGTWTYFRYRHGVSYPRLTKAAAING